MIRIRVKIQSLKLSETVADRVTRLYSLHEHLSFQPDKQTIVLLQRIRLIWFDKYHKSFNYIHYNTFIFKHYENRQHFLHVICFLI